jgi:hypothetical protein
MGSVRAVADISPQLGLPTLPDVLLGLTSVSAVGYVGKKTLTPRVPTITTSWRCWIGWLVSPVGACSCPPYGGRQAAAPLNRSLPASPCRKAG